MTDPTQQGAADVAPFSPNGTAQVQPGNALHWYAPRTLSAVLYAAARNAGFKWQKGEGYWKSQDTSAARSFLLDHGVKIEAMKLLPFATTQTPRGYYKNSPDSFWARVKRGDPKACWPWQGTISRTGYGVITYHKRQWRTHRLAWVLTHGEIPEGLFVCHHCDNPICCNPQHLFLGTPLDNARDMVAKGRSCKGEKHAVRKGTRTMLRGDEHPLRKNPAAAARGERNSAAILTEAEVLEIRRRAAEGETIYRLAKVFSVSKRTIQFIVRGKTWRHLLEE